MTTYSFLDVSATLSGPTGSVSVGAGSGADKGGISVDPAGDINTMTIGADGTGQHSLHADRSGTITVRLLKTSPVNSVLSSMYAQQTANPALHGNNVLTISSLTMGDLVSCRGVAFKKAPSLVYDAEGPSNEWTFDATLIDRDLGAGALV